MLPSTRLAPKLSSFLASHFHFKGNSPNDPQTTPRRHPSPKSKPTAKTQHIQQDSSALRISFKPGIITV
jgi:hypothetical protein